jgi:thioredoxin 1
MSVGLALTSATFDEVVHGSDRPVLVDFWATWCPPCRRFDPVLEALAAEDDRFVLASVDLDAHPELARRFAVMSAPTVVLLDGADTLWRSVGARSLVALRDDLDPVLRRLPLQTHDRQ